MKEFALVKDALYDDELFAIVTRDNGLISCQGLHDAGREWAHSYNQGQTKSLEDNLGPGVSVGPFAPITPMTQALIDESLEGKPVRFPDLNSLCFIESVDFGHRQSIPQVKDARLRNITLSGLHRGADYKAMAFLLDSGRSSVLLKARLGSMGFDKNGIGFKSRHIEKSVLNEEMSNTAIGYGNSRRAVRDVIVRKHLLVRGHSGYISKDKPEPINVIRTKANRLGRRLAPGGGGGIGGGIRKIGRSMKDPFDPNAWDGDKDGIVQEGTIWERPSVPGINTNLPGMRSTRNKPSNFPADDPQRVGEDIARRQNEDRLARKLEGMDIRSILADEGISEDAKRPLRNTLTGFPEDSDAWDTPLIELMDEGQYFGQDDVDRLVETAIADGFGGGRGARSSRRQGERGGMRSRLLGEDGLIRRDAKWQDRVDEIMWENGLSRDAAHREYEREENAAWAKLTPEQQQRHTDDNAYGVGKNQFHWMPDNYLEWSIRDGEKELTETQERLARVLDEGPVDPTGTWRDGEEADYLRRRIAKSQSRLDDEKREWKRREAGRLAGGQFVGRTGMRSQRGMTDAEKRYVELRKLSKRELREMAKEAGIYDHRKSDSQLRRELAGIPEPVPGGMRSRRGGDRVDAEGMQAIAEMGDNDIDNRIAVDRAGGMTLEEASKKYGLSREVIRAREIQHRRRRREGDRGGMRSRRADRESREERERIVQALMSTDGSMPERWSGMSRQEAIEELQRLGGNDRALLFRAIKVRGQAPYGYRPGGRGGMRSSRGGDDHTAHLTSDELLALDDVMGEIREMTAGAYFGDDDELAIIDNLENAIGEALDAQDVMLLGDRKRVDDTIDFLLRLHAGQDDPWADLSDLIGVLESSRDSGDGNWVSPNLTDRGYMLPEPGRGGMRSRRGGMRSQNGSYPPSPRGDADRHRRSGASSNALAASRRDDGPDERFLDNDVIGDIRNRSLNDLYENDLISPEVDRYINEKLVPEGLGEGDPEWDYIMNEKIDELTMTRLGEKILEAIEEDFREGNQDWYRERFGGGGAGPDTRGEARGMRSMRVPAGRRGRGGVRARQREAATDRVAMPRGVDGMRSRRRAGAILDPRRGGEHAFSDNDGEIWKSLEPEEKAAIVEAARFELNKLMWGLGGGDVAEGSEYSSSQSTVDGRVVRTADLDDDQKVERVNRGLLGTATRWFDKHIRGDNQGEDDDFFRDYVFTDKDIADLGGAAASSPNVSEDQKKKLVTYTEDIATLRRMVERAEDGDTDGFQFLEHISKNRRKNIHARAKQKMSHGNTPMRDKKNIGGAKAWERPSTLNTPEAQRAARRATEEGTRAGKRENWARRMQDRIMIPDPERARRRLLRAQKRRGGSGGGGTEQQRRRSAIERAMSKAKRKARSLLRGKKDEKKVLAEADKNMGHKIVKVDADGKVELGDIKEFSKALAAYRKDPGALKVQTKGTDGKAHGEDIAAERNADMGIIWQIHGMNGLPILVSQSEMEGLADQGWTMIVRGHGSGKGGVDNAENWLTDELRFLPGRGGEAYGSGEYWATGGGFASWRHDVDQNSTVALIPPTARRISQSDAHEQASANKRITEVFNLVASTYPGDEIEHADPKELAAQIRAEFDKADPRNWETEVGQLWQRLLETMGNGDPDSVNAMLMFKKISRADRNLIAPALGYDVIDVANGPTLVMNRSAMVALDGAVNEGQFQKLHRIAAQARADRRG